MNTVRINKKIVGGLLLALVLTACQSTPMTTKPIAVEEKSPVTQPLSKITESNPAPAVEKEVVTDTVVVASAMNPLKDPNNILSKRNVFFDFDSDVVKAEFRPVIEAHAKYLLANANAKMVLQGNTDERGTREYNLALGQRRSVAVKKSMNLLGVQDKQIETVSYGKEKANPNCADEDCFKTNRRVDIVYENE